MLRVEHLERPFYEGFPGIYVLRRGGGHLGNEVGDEFVDGVARGLWGGKAVVRVTLLQQTGQRMSAQRTVNLQTQTNNRSSNGQFLSLAR